MRGGVRAAHRYIGGAVLVTAAVTVALYVVVPVAVAAFVTAFTACAVLVGALAIGVRSLPIATMHVLLAAFAVGAGVVWAFAAQRLESQLGPAALAVALGGVALLGVYAAVRAGELRVVLLRSVPADTVRRAAILCAISPYLDLANLIADVLRALRSWAADLASVLLDPLMWLARLLQYVLNLIGRALGAVAKGLFDAWGW